MKKFDKLKIFIAGSLVGAVIMSAVPVAAAAETVIAYVQQGANIILNGEYVTIRPDMRVLNYGDRVYVPIRLVAEAMGGEVNWSSSANAVIIDMTKATPPPTASPTPSPTPTPTATPTPKPEYENYYYQKLPITSENAIAKITVSDVFINNDGGIYFVMAIENKHYNPIRYLYNDQASYANAYGNVMRADNDENFYWDYTILQGVEISNSIRFETYEKGANGVILRIPVSYTDGNSKSYVEMFTLYIDLKDVNNNTK